MFIIALSTLNNRCCALEVAEKSAFGVSLIHSLTRSDDFLSFLSLTEINAKFPPFFPPTEKK